MSAVRQARATLDDLYRTPEKAELIGGRIVRFMATGYQPNRVAGRIYRSLDDYADTTRRGVACTDNVGFAVPELPSGRVPDEYRGRYVVTLNPAFFDRPAPLTQPQLLVIETWGHDDVLELRRRLHDTLDWTALRTALRP